jgi:hypothetical protein
MDVTVSPTTQLMPVVPVTSSIPIAAVRLTIPAGRISDDDSRGACWKQHKQHRNRQDHASPLCIIVFISLFLS